MIVQPSGDSLPIEHASSYVVSGSMRRKALNSHAKTWLRTRPHTSSFNRNWVGRRLRERTPSDSRPSRYYGVEPWLTRRPDAKGELVVSCPTLVISRVSIFDAVILTWSYYPGKQTGRARTPSLKLPCLARPGLLCNNVQLHSVVQYSVQQASRGHRSTSHWHWPVLGPRPFREFSSLIPVRDLTNM